jgi:hypothetical protein
MEPEIPPKQAVMERILSEMPEHDQLPFLAHLEQRAKQEGDLASLREYRLYRQRHNL